MMNDHSRAFRCLGVKLIAATCLLALFVLPGCQTMPPRIGGPTRAIWVTRYDFKTKADVENIMANCRDAGFNTVMFQVRGNGTAFYQSSFEPWADELGGAYPGFDPLKQACEEGHARGLDVHAWVNVMPAWRGETPPSNPEQLYNQHPEWFLYDQEGRRQPLNSHYVSLNPCLPEVRHYLTSVFEEIVTKYAVDGLHMDYIRFPIEPPMVPESPLPVDYPRDPTTLLLFRQQAKAAPYQKPALWAAWKGRQVSKLVAQINDMMKEQRPDAVLSAAVNRDQREGLRYFQDTSEWMKAGVLDAVYPMIYTADSDAFRETLGKWLIAEQAGHIEIVPGLWFDESLEPEFGAQVVRDQLSAAISQADTFCLFAYSNLFGRVSGIPVARDQGQARRIRRDIVLPYIRSMAPEEPMAKPAVRLP